MALLLRSLLVFGVVFALTADVSAAKAKKKGGGVSGTIVSITPDKDDKDTGTIKIKVSAGKKGDAANNGEEKTFKYNKDTKYFKAEGKKNEVAATFSDLATGTNVTIMATGDTADKVTIAGKKKKNK